MSFQNMVRVCVVMLVLATAPAAAGAPRLSLYPVVLIGYIGSALQLGLELPCGGSFYGLIAREDGQGGLTLGAAVAQERSVCAAVPRPMVVVVDYLDVHGFKEIAPMDVPAPRRLTLSPLLELRLVEPVGATGPELTALGEPHCGEPLGTLVRQVSGRRIELAFVARANPKAAKAPEGDCRVRSSWRTIKALASEARREATVLQEKRPTSLRRAVTLRLAPVTVGARPGQGLRVHYQRACNEAPVGIVLGQASRQGAEAPTVQVGMLVAHYYNLPCTQGSSVLSAHETKDLDLPKGWRAASVGPEVLGGGWRLKAPTAVAKVAGRGVRLDYVASCQGGPDWAVYARDGQGKLAVGLLAPERDGVERCQRRPAVRSLVQPLVAGPGRSEALYPLRLKGI